MYFRPDIGPRSVPLEIDLKALDLQDAVVVRSTNWLGDAIMTLPGVYQLFQEFPPDVKRVVLCSDKLEAFWQAVPWVEEVISYKKKSLEPDVIERIHRLNPGLTVVLPNSFGSTLHLWKAKVKNLFGRRGQLRGAMLKYSIPEYRRKAGKDQWHQARHYLELAACVGAKTWDCDFLPMVADLPGRRATELLPFAPDEQILVIAPGAAYGPAKQWPIESFKAVARWWSDSIGPVVCTGAPNEFEIGEDVVNGISGAINLTGKSSLFELVHIIGRSRCVLANDSGTMHLGGGMKKDGVAIFGSTDPITTGPIGGRWVIKEIPMECRPCLKRECPLTENTYGCLTGITPPSVIDSLEGLLTCE